MDSEIGSDELETLLDDENARIVDIRPPRAFERGHIPGSENVPLQRLVDDIEQFEGDERVVTVCPKGKSSVQAARLIASFEGFSGRADSFEPGLRKWDGPIESGRDESGGRSGSSGRNENSDGTPDEGPEAPF